MSSGQGDGKLFRAYLEALHFMGKMFVEFYVSIFLIL